MAKAKTAQMKRLKKYWADKNIPLDPITGLPAMAGGAGVSAGISSPGGGSVGNNVFDLYAQAPLTDVVLRSLEIAWETIPHIGAEIAPLVPTMDRLVRRDVAEVAPFGIGQFRAPDATPAIYNPRINYAEEVNELLILDEMSSINEDLYIRLTSENDSIRARAGIDLITMGKILQLRHERLTEAMRWQVFKGNPVIVNYPGGSKIELKYNYLETHKPSATIPWTDRINSTPIDDMRAWQKIIQNDIGVYGSRFHMNSYTYEKLQRSNQARGYLTPTDRNTFLPTPDDILSLLWGSTPSDAQGGSAAEQPKIIVTDSGIREETSEVAGEGMLGYNRGANSVNNYLQNGEILLTTDYIFEGEHICDVLDGPVLLADSWNSLKKYIGAQSQLLVKPENSSIFIRQGCSRMVRLRRPQAFLLAKAF